MCDLEPPYDTPAEPSDCNNEAVRDFMEWFGLTEDSSLAEAYWACANLSEYGGYYDTAFEYYLMSATLGWPESMGRLACYYMNGVGVGLDLMEGLKWARMGAEQNNPVAQLALGVFYGLGLGIHQDLTEAHHWIELSAKQGLAEAQHMLSTLCSFGGGCPVDLPAALALATLAFTGGSEDADKLQDELFGSMTSDQICEAIKISKKWKTQQEAADKHKTHSN